MLKQILCLLLLPTLSWGSTCIVPTKNLEIAELWLQQPVHEFIVKQNNRVDKVFEDEYDSREGSLDFDNRQRKVNGIGEVLIRDIAFNVDSNQITSFILMPTDSTGNLVEDTNRLMDKVSIPRHLWTKERYSYRYLCDDYEVEIDQNKSRQETWLSIRSSASEHYNQREPEYFFTAKQFISTKVHEQMASEEGAYTSHDLYKNDPIFSKKLNEVVLNKLGLTIDDFDMGVSLDSENIKGNIITMQFWNDKIHMYVAYNAYKNNMLAVVRGDDESLKTYGDKSSWLTIALIESDGLPLDWVTIPTIRH